MRLFALLFALGLLDQYLSDANNEAHSSIFSNESPNLHVDSKYGSDSNDRIDNCTKFDDLWDQPSHEYRIPRKSFCSDYCSLFRIKRPDPFWFDCDQAIMPNIEFYFSEYFVSSCNVTTANGIMDNMNKQCINHVSEFFNRWSHHANNKLVYLAHGFAWGLDKRINRDWLIEMKDSLLQRYFNSNIVVAVVRWDVGASVLPRRRTSINSPKGYTLDENKVSHRALCCGQQGLDQPSYQGLPINYGTAASNTWPVGNILAYVNEHISRATTSNTFKTTCIGHSLGSQICGFFGKMSKKLNPPKTIDRIIGLDPAGPIFDFKEQDVTLKLDKSDALKVEVYHTNSQLLGFNDPIGDIDFYFNGGNRQRDISPAGNLLAKSHNMVVQFFIKLNENSFPCYADWKCHIAKGSDLKDIRKFEDRKQRSKLRQFCAVTQSKVQIGDLDDLSTRNKGVYWVDVYRTSKTCNTDKVLPLNDCCQGICNWIATGEVNYPICVRQCSTTIKTGGCNKLCDDLYGFKNTGCILACNTGAQACDLEMGVSNVSVKDQSQRNDHHHTRSEFESDGGNNITGGMNSLGGGEANKAIDLKSVPKCRDKSKGNKVWKDYHGFRCRLYEGAKWCTPDGRQGSGWFGGNGPKRWMKIKDHAPDDGPFKGVDALQACCACGGGSSKGKYKSVEKYPYNDNNWRDQHGYTCRAYYYGNFCRNGDQWNEANGGGWQDGWGNIRNYKDAGRNPLQACKACQRNARTQLTTGSIPSIERLFEFETRIIGGTKGMMLLENGSRPLEEDINPDLRMTAKVRMQSYPDHTMRVKIENIKFHMMGEDADLMNDRGNLDSYNEMTLKHDNEQFLRYLEEPLIVLMKGNVFKKLVVSRDEPENVTILKKSLLKELKRNGSSPHLRLLKTSGILKPIEIPFQPYEITL